MNKQLFDRLIKRVHRWINRERYRKTEINLTVSLSSQGKVTADYIGDDIALLMLLIGDSDTFAELAELGLIKRYALLSPLTRREKFEALWQMCEGAEEAMHQPASEQLQKSSDARKILDN